MTATTATTIPSFPRNRTGLFAADGLQDAKGAAKNQAAVSATLPRPSRNSNSINLLIPLSDHNTAPVQPYRLPRNDTQLSSRTNRNSDSRTEASNESYVTMSTMRTSFRPSPLRRQKLHVTTSLTQRDLKETIPKQPFVSSQASSKLKSEIEQINSKLKLHGELNKLLRLPPTRDSTGTPRSALSHTTSCRLSSASTNILVDRAHQRFPSAMTNVTIPTVPSTPGLTETVNRPTITLTVPSAFNQEEEHSHLGLSHHVVTHAYQIPQQANVGCDTLFPLNPPPSPSVFKTHAIKHDSRSQRNKSAAYPFYVMYFTNLKMNQNQANNNNNHADNNENNKRPVVLSATPLRKKTANSRIGTSYPRSQSTKRRPPSPTSIHTYSIVDDEDSMINSTSYYNSKRFSAKIAAFEKENSDLLKDVLRTTSWNHVQV